MDDISELLLGPQRSTGSSFGIALAVIGTAVAVALLVYLLRCYVQEAFMRKRVKRLVCGSHGVNVVPSKAMPSETAFSETKRLRKKSSRILPSPHSADRKIKVRRRAPHPWKQQFLVDSPTPH